MSGEVLSLNPKVTHHLAIIAKYLPGHNIFKAKGKLHEKITLPGASLINVCQDLDIVIAPITVDPAPTVKADLASPGGRPSWLSVRQARSTSHKTSSTT